MLGGLTYSGCRSSDLYTRERCQEGLNADHRKTKEKAKPSACRYECVFAQSIAPVCITDHSYSSAVSYAGLHPACILPNKADLQKSECQQGPLQTYQSTTVPASTSLLFSAKPPHWSIPPTSYAMKPALSQVSKSAAPTSSPGSP
jgi:hypothetical protein